MGNRSGHVADNDDLRTLSFLLPPDDIEGHAVHPGIGPHGATYIKLPPRLFLAPTGVLYGKPLGDLGDKDFHALHV